MSLQGLGTELSLTIIALMLPAAIALIRWYASYRIMIKEHEAQEKRISQLERRSMTLATKDDHHQLSEKLEEMTREFNALSTEVREFMAYQKGKSDKSGQHEKSDWGPK